MTEVRRLVILRHAKAEGYAASDFERRLTTRGRRDAADAGRFLAERALVPEHVLVSSAARAVETWDRVREHCGGDPVVDATRALYGAGPEEILDAVRAVPDEVGTVLFVGHNPGAADAASVLDDHDGDAEASAVLIEGLPTSAVVVFEIAVSWAEVGHGTGRLTHAHVGRG